MDTKIQTSSVMHPVGGRNTNASVTVTVMKQPMIMLQIQTCSVVSNKVDDVD